VKLIGALLDALAAIGADAPGITRDAYGPGEDRAHALVAGVAREMGLQCQVDAAANLHMVWPGSDAALPMVLVGSHLDSVPHGGNFDGAAGVVAGLAAVASLQASGFRPRRSIGVLALRCEESPWFQMGLIGSRALCGTLPPAALELRRAGTGRTLAEHIRASGGDPEAIGRPLLPRDRIAAYVEVHIEQAPQLLEAGKPIGICAGMPGNLRHPFIRITGADAHTGLPHRFRQDAALAGADLALALEAMWLDEAATGRQMAVTIGRFHTNPARHELTVVPGDFTLSLDLRAYDAAHLAALERRLHAIVADVAARRRVSIALGERVAAAPGLMDAGVQSALVAAALRCGVPSVPLASPGTHDANNFGAFGVPIGMILVRNANGSHNPDEAMDVADLAAAVDVLAAWLR
jgi:N-carbamoyl-L-amino-acid hydrolase